MFPYSYLNFNLHLINYTSPVGGRYINYISSVDLIYPPPPSATFRGYRRRLVCIRCVPTEDVVGRWGHPRAVRPLFITLRKRLDMPR